MEVLLITERWTIHNGKNTPSNKWQKLKISRESKRTQEVVTQPHLVKFASESGDKSCWAVPSSALGHLQHGMCTAFDTCLWKVSKAFKNSFQGS